MEQTEHLEEEPPLLEGRVLVFFPAYHGFYTDALAELGIHPGHILAKTLTVFNPRKEIGWWMRITFLEDRIRVQIRRGRPS